MIYERIIELIVILLQELKSNKQLEKSDIDKLSQRGYTQNEINTAFSWIYSKFYEGDKVYIEDIKTEHSHRFLHEVEQRIITSQAFGYMIQLRELGILNDFDIEVIIEKIMASGYLKVTLNEMKSFISLYLVDIDESTNPNKRISININDSVN